MKHDPSHGVVCSILYKAEVLTEHGQLAWVTYAPHAVANSTALRSSSPSLVSASTPPAQRGTVVLLGLTCRRPHELDQLARAAAICQRSRHGPRTVKGQ